MDAQDLRRALTVGMIVLAIAVLLHALGARNDDDPPVPTTPLTPVVFPKGTYPYCMGRASAPCKTP